MDKESGSTGSVRRGRPPKFSTPEELEDKFFEWKTLFAEGGELADDIPDIEGFCHYVDAYRDLLCEYEGKPLFSDTVKRIKNWIHYRKKQLAMKGKMNAAVYIFDAKNNAGYVDKNEVDQKNTGEIIIKTVSYKDSSSDSDAPV